MSHSSNAKTTTKVSSLNLYKKKPNSRAAIGSGRSLLVIGRGKGRGLAKKPIIAPKPINLPSVKKESKGFDPSVVIIPVGSKPGWGSNAGPGWGSNVGPSWGSHTGPPKSHASPTPPPVASRGAPRSSHSPSRSPHQRSESETRSRARSESETAGKTWADEAELDDDFYEQPVVFPTEARQQEESSTSPPIAQGKSRGPSTSVSEEDRHYASKVVPDKRPPERDQDRRSLPSAPPQTAKPVEEDQDRQYMKRVAAVKRAKALEEEARREAVQKANARAKLAEVERRMFQKQPLREEDDREPEELSRRQGRRESDRNSPEPGYQDEQEEEREDDGNEEYEDLHLPRDDLGRPLPTPAYSPSLPHRGGFDPVPQFKLMQRPKGPIPGEKPEQQQQLPRGLNSIPPTNEPSLSRGPGPEMDPTKKPSLLKNNGTNVSQNNKPPDREVIPTSVWKTPTPPQPPPVPVPQAPISPSLLHTPIFASPPTQPQRERGLGDRRREFVGRRIWADELPPDPRIESARPLPGIQSYLPAYARKPDKTLVKSGEGETAHPSSSSSSSSTAPISPSLISPSIPKNDPQSLENKTKTNELPSSISTTTPPGPASTSSLPSKPETPSSRRTPTHDSPRKGKGAGFYKYVAKSKSLEDDKLSSTGTEGSENNQQQRTPRAARTPRKTPNVSSGGGSGGSTGPLIYRAVGTKSGHPNWEAGSPVGTNMNTGAPRVPSTGADGVASFQEGNEAGNTSELSQSKESKAGKRPKPEKYPHIDQDQLNLLRQSLLANNVVVIDGQSQPDNEDLDGFTEVLGKKEKRTKKKEQKEQNEKEAARLSREKREKEKKESQEKQQSPSQPSPKSTTTNNIPNNNRRGKVDSSSEIDQSSSGSAQSPKAISSKRESPQVLHPLGSQDRSSKKIDLSGPRPLIHSNQVEHLENNIEHAKIMSDVTSSEQTEGDLALASRLTPRKSNLSSPTDDSLTKSNRPLLSSSSPLLTSISSIVPSSTKSLKTTKATVGRSAFSPSSTSSFSSSVHKIREFVPLAERQKKEQAAVALSTSQHLTRSPIDSRVPVAIVVPHLSLQQQFGVSNYGREPAESVPVSWDTSMLPVSAAQAPTSLTSSAFQPLSNIGPYSHLVDPMAPDPDLDLQEQEQDELQMSVESQPPQSLSQLPHPQHSQPIYDMDQYTSGPPTLYYNSQPYETIFSNQPVDTGASHEVRYTHASHAAQQQRLALLGNGVRQGVVDYNAPFILQPTQGVQQNLDPHSRFNGGLWKPGDTELRSFPQRQIPQHSSSPHQHPSPPHPFQPMTVNRSRTPGRLQQVDSLYSTQTTHDGIGLHSPFPQGVSSFSPALSRLPMQSLPIQPHQQQQHRQSPVQFAPQPLRKSPIIPQRSESAPQREVNKHLDQVGIGMGKGLGSELGQSLSTGNLTSFVSDNPPPSEHYQGRSRSVPLQSFAPSSPLPDSPQNIGGPKHPPRSVHTLSRKDTSPQPQSQGPPPSLNRGSRANYPRPSTQFPVSLPPPPFSNQMSPPIVRPLLPHPPYRPPGLAPRPPPPRGVRLVQSGGYPQQPPRNRRGPLVPPTSSSTPPPQAPRVPLQLPLPLPLPEKHHLHPKFPPSMPTRPTRPPRVNQQRAQDAALSFERESPKPEQFVKPEPEPPFPQETVLPPEPTLESELPNSIEAEPKEEIDTTKKPIERPPRTSWAPKTSGSRGRGGYRSHRTPGPNRPAASGSRTSSAPNYIYRKKPGVSTSQPVSQDNQSSPFESSPDASSQGASLSTISSRLSNLSFDWPFSPSSSSQTNTTSGQSS